MHRKLDSGRANVPLSFLMEVETLGVARSLGWRVHTRCANGYREGIASQPQIPRVRLMVTTKLFAHHLLLNGGGAVAVHRPTRKGELREDLTTPSSSKRYQRCAGSTTLKLYYQNITSNIGIRN